MLEAVERYLLMRESLGYIDTDVARDLRAFAKFADRRAATHVRTEDALAWVKRHAPLRRFALLACARRLGIYLHAEDQDHEVVPEEYTREPRRSRRRPPFIYTDREIARVLKGFAAIPVPHPFDAITYRHIIALIAATGLRVSEALKLETADLKGPKLFVRKGKFGKDRVIYLHPTTVLALERYQRSKPLELDGPGLFITHTNKPPLPETMGKYFRLCIKHIGLKARGGSLPPRIHDLRHTFAVRSLAACAFDRQKVSRHVIALSTYMGHVSVVSTFWYCELDAASKQSMAQALEDAFDV